MLILQPPYSCSWLGKTKNTDTTPVFSANLSVLKFLALKPVSLLSLLNARLHGPSSLVLICSDTDAVSPWGSLCSCALSVEQRKHHLCTSWCWKLIYAKLFATEKCLLLLLQHYFTVDLLKVFNFSKLFPNLHFSCICQILRLIPDSEPIILSPLVRTCLERGFLPYWPTLCHGIERLERSWPLFWAQFQTHSCKGRKSNWLKTSDHSIFLKSHYVNFPWGTSLSQLHCSVT